MAGRHVIDISAENRHLGGLAGKIMIPAAILGLAGLGISAGVGLTGDDASRDRFWQAYLVAFCLGTAITLGALFFTILHHLARAGWSVVIRRIAEAFACNAIVMLVLFLPLAWLMLQGPDIELFPWKDPALVDHGSSSFDAIVAHKSAFLNPTFFLVRAGIYFLVWIGLSSFFFRLSVRQDQTGDPELSRRMMKFSAPSMILFALTLTFAAFDWLMTQDPHWYSTIFGVYFFAGAVCSFLSVAILFAAFLQRTGRLSHAITAEHFHDLGKLVFAFGVVFWAYIGFSQYMLQWYGNIPEETAWWQARASDLAQTITYHGRTFVPGEWTGWTWFLLIGHFIAPFLAIISRHPKRVRSLLVVASLWMLFMCWYDLFWLVMPVFHPGDAGMDMPKFPLLDAAAALGIVGVCVASAAFRLRSVSLIAEKDPRLAESLAFENL